MGAAIDGCDARGRCKRRTWRRAEFGCSAPLELWPSAGLRCVADDDDNDDDATTPLVWGFASALFWRCCVVGAVAIVCAPRNCGGPLLGPALGVDVIVAVTSDL